jgi:hypothetical protein
MGTAKIVTGIEILDDLCKALGINLPVRRIVIDVHNGNVPIVYYETLMTEDQAERLINVDLSSALKVEVKGETDAESE